jgi:hypothetical protein
MPEISKAILKSLVNQDLKLEYNAAQVLQSNLAAARNELAKFSDFRQAQYGPIIDEYYNEALKKYPTQDLYNRGQSEGKFIVGEGAQVGADSSFWKWVPTIPIGAISLAEAEMATLITKASDDLKTSILRKVQQGIALGATSQEIKDSILGTGLKGSKGRGGVFRSASVRAETIGRTVANELINRGAMSTYSQVDKLCPELALNKVWQTLSDNRTSDRCLSLSGQRKELTEDFKARDGWTGANPPGHPNCRSRVTTVSKRYRKKWDNRFTESPTSAPKKGRPKAKPKVKPNENPAPTKVDKRVGKIEPLQQDTIAAGLPHITSENLSKAIAQLPEEQAQLISRAINKSQIQIVYPHKGSDKTDHKFLSAADKNLKVKWPAHITDSQGKSGNLRTALWSLPKPKANGFTGKAYNHVSVNTIYKTSEFSPNIKEIKNRAKVTIEKAKKASGRYQLDWSNSDPWTKGSDEQVFNTTLHELGHQFHYKAGTPNIPSGAKQITAYGDPEVNLEWHAEAFAMWSINPQGYKEFDPIGYNHIQNIMQTAATKPDLGHIPALIRTNSMIKRFP